MLAPANEVSSDFSSMLALFPNYQQSLALQQQGIGAADAQLNAQRQQAIINFGDPSILEKVEPGSPFPKESLAVG